MNNRTHAIKSGWFQQQVERAEQEAQSWPNWMRKDGAHRAADEGRSCVASSEHESTLHKRK